MLARMPTISRFFRYLGAVLYDALILCALFMIATGVLLFFRQGSAIPSATFWYQCVLVGIAYAYVAGSIVYGGQTIGMRAWAFAYRYPEKNSNPWRALHQRWLWLLPASLCALFSPKKARKFLEKRGAALLFQRR